MKTHENSREEYLDTMMNVLVDLCLSRSLAEFVPGSSRATLSCRTLIGEGRREFPRGRRISSSTTRAGRRGQQ
jgi:hypothetical protein